MLWAHPRCEGMHTRVRPLLVLFPHESLVDVNALNDGDHARPRAITMPNIGGDKLNFYLATTVHWKQLRIPFRCRWSDHSIGSLHAVTKALTRTLVNENDGFAAHYGWHIARLMSALHCRV
jgi:hypothetical protein